MSSLIDELLRATTRRGRAASGMFALEGLRLVERAVRAGVPVARVGVDTDRLSEPDAWLSRVLEQCADASIPVEPVEPDELRRLVGARDLGGVVALAPRPAMTSELRPPPAVFRALCLDETHDPGNIGALIRTAHACGVSTVVLVGATDPFHPRAVRTSMGSLFRVELAHAETWKDGLAMLQAHDVPSFATVASGGTPLGRARAPERAAIWMGSEAHGLSEQLACTCEHRVTIPMPDGVDSFSVNAAAAIACWELRWRGA